MPITHKDVILIGHYSYTSIENRIESIRQCIPSHIGLTHPINKIAKTEKPIYICYNIPAFEAEAIEKRLKMNGFIINCPGHVSVAKPEMDLRTKKKIKISVKETIETESFENIDFDNI